MLPSLGIGRLIKSSIRHVSRKRRGGGGVVLFSRCLCVRTGDNGSDAESTTPPPPPPTAADHYDVVISGGGMVGFAMASALGKSARLSDRRVLLLEGGAERVWDLSPDYSNRVCALNPTTQHLFTSLGVWQRILDMRAQPVKRMQVWEACSEAMITFEGDEERPVAHMVENDVTLQALKSLIPSHVQVEYNSRVSGYQLPQDTSSTVTITLKNGRTISTDLLIGADGVRSGVRAAMGVQYLGWEYDQMGIVATLELSEPTDNTVAWQRFLPTGPVALLPLSEDKSSLVWSTTKETAQHLLSLSDEDFTDALNRAIWDDKPRDARLESVHKGWLKLLETVLPWTNEGVVRQLPPSVTRVMASSRASFPLGLGHAVHYVAPRVALIGDAAHRIHPLAGQGVNLGFGDVATLLETLEKAVLLGADIGDERMLYEYERGRQRHNVATMTSVEALYRLYTSEAPPLVLLRSLGLSAVNLITPVKERIMSHANG
ncbi:hypothetical protein Pcinc_037588 [Petrolisthes cinctipes]|uniref:Ubiquinone biosynthesis monooxygenase COQ6, mitochondrial n=1 Tax=Petrolisthes cinctipes TaxID=88211 RepID=A0AAE1EMF6_PETCI|nr:hypothetical protein Pcinc_037588 [Petrolisthes cinctipes]